MLLLPVRAVRSVSINDHHLDQTGDAPRLIAARALTRERPLAVMRRPLFAQGQAEPVTTSAHPMYRIGQD